jgi:hypothetical protein
MVVLWVGRMFGGAHNRQWWAVAFWQVGPIQRMQAGHAPQHLLGFLNRTHLWMRFELLI